MGLFGKTRESNTTSDDSVLKRARQLCYDVRPLPVFNTRVVVDYFDVIH